MAVQSLRFAEIAHIALQRLGAVDSPGATRVSGALYVAVIHATKDASVTRLFPTTDDAA